MPSTQQLTPEFLADMLMPSDPQISPDGRWIAASVTATAKANEHRNAAIWLADSAGSTSTHQITTGTANDTHPQWSPDSRTLAFLSDRGKRGTNQLQLLSFDGGEAREITSIRGGVSDFCWMPGGTHIAYLAIDARDEDEERRRNDERDDPNVYGAFWPRARIVIRDLQTNDERPIDTGDLHVSDIVASPDGSRLAAVVSETSEIDSLLGSGRIAVIDIASGAMIDVVDLGFWASSIVWSRDGSNLFFIGASGQSPVSSSQLWMVDEAGTTAPRCISVDAPYCFGSLTRATDRDEIIAVIVCGVESEIHHIDPVTYERRVITHVGGNINGLTASDDGSTLGLLVSTPEHPDDIFVQESDRDLTRLSTLNDAIENISLGPQEVLTWERAGVGLDGILIWPPGKSRTDGPLPCIVSIHGGPYGRWSNEFITRFGRWIAQHGYLVFLPNPRGGSGHGAAFAESVKDIVGNDDYLDIMSGVDLLVEQGLANPDKLGCGGWSQGGFMTAWIVGHTTRFKAGVMGAGVSDWGMMIATSDIPTYEQYMGGGDPYTGVGPHSFDAQSPASFVSNVETPVLIVHGENDERVPVSQGIHFFRGLRRHGVPTELVTYPREPHGIQERLHQIDLNRRIVDWFQRWIPVDGD